MMVRGETNWWDANKALLVRTDIHCDRQHIFHCIQCEKRSWLSSKWNWNDKRWDCSTTVVGLWTVVHLLEIDPLPRRSGVVDGFQIFAYTTVDLHAIRPKSHAGTFPKSIYGRMNRLRTPSEEKSKKDLSSSKIATYLLSSI